MCIGWGPTTIYVKPSSADPCTTAGCTGTYDGCWTGDYDDGGADTDKICINSGASTADGSLNGSPDISSSYGETGNGIRFDVTDESLEWPVTSGNIFTSSSGTVCLNIYLQDSTQQIMLFEAYTNSSYELRFYTEIDNTVTCRHEGNNVVVDTGTDNSDTVTDQTWTIVCCSWDIDNDCVDADDGCLSTWVEGGSGWVDDADPDILTPWTGNEPATVKIGEEDSNIGGNTATVYIDWVKTWNSQKAYP